MARIVHIAIKVENLENATRFYEDVYGFKQVSTERNGQHVSRHMTDGYIDLALMIYDSEEAPEAQLAGRGPCIHHIGIEVDDRTFRMMGLLAHNLCMRSHLQIKAGSQPREMRCHCCHY
jgi:catechol 2,3-dioxygenase-like lactoylglutathione lyase family enzyme